MIRDREGGRQANGYKLERKMGEQGRTGPVGGEHMGKIQSQVDQVKRYTTIGRACVGVRGCLLGNYGGGVRGQSKKWRLFVLVPTTSGIAAMAVLSRSCVVWTR